MTLIKLSINFLDDKGNSEPLRTIHPSKGPSFFWLKSSHTVLQKGLENSKDGTLWYKLLREKASIFRFPFEFFSLLIFLTEEYYSKEKQGK